jgi:hypothetical protein
MFRIFYSIGPFLIFTPQESGITVGSKSVPPAVAGGSTIGIQYQWEYRMLNIDPPATAGGTDLDPSATHHF